MFATLVIIYILLAFFYDVDKVEIYKILIFTSLATLIPMCVYSVYSMIYSKVDLMVISLMVLL